MRKKKKVAMDYGKSFAVINDLSARLFKCISTGRDTSLYILFKERWKSRQIVKIIRELVMRLTLNRNQIGVLASSS